MASSRVMASSSPPQHAGAGSSSDLARFKSSGVGSMNMDDIIRNIYGPEAVNAAAAESAGLGPAEPSLAAPEAAARRTSEEVWKEISAAGGLPAPVLHIPPAASSGAGARGGGGAAEMTLEDFLARDSCGRAAVMEGNMALGFPDGDGDAAGSVAGGVGGAYVAELESQVMQLEEEQTELLREQVLFLVLHSGNGVVLGGPFQPLDPRPHLVPVALFENIALYKHCAIAQLVIPRIL
ncbi:G-box-binding factor 4 [Zea mays]|uniref:G-box-binding factor 4 n=1 Tax=Zea mays TaxID=4577 RepID=A0A1D6FPK1_MAIZE|nr:G-box-binding factor 4 [Zea mays]